MLETVLTIGYAMLGTAFAIALYRVVKGPTHSDRIVALDLAAGLSMGAVALMAIDSEKSLYLNIAACIALLAFMSTVALSRFLGLRAQKDLS